MAADLISVAWANQRRIQESSHRSAYLTYIYFQNTQDLGDYVSKWAYFKLRHHYRLFLNFIT